MSKLVEDRKTTSRREWLNTQEYLQDILMDGYHRIVNSKVCTLHPWQVDRLKAKCEKTIDFVKKKLKAEIISFDTIAKSGFFSQLSP